MITKKNSLDRGGKAEAAQLGAVVDEQVAIAEQCRRRGQYLRHLVPAPKLEPARQSAPRSIPVQKELPSPLPNPRIAHRERRQGTLVSDG